MLIPVVLSGGSGSRLWPVSREFSPKQLLPLVGEETMLQNTLIRLSGVHGLGSPILVCNEIHRFMVAEQLRQISQESFAILLEPMGRNTAPAVAVAALLAVAEGDDPILLVLPADHVILDAETLCHTIEAGKELARNGKLVTFGVVPDTPKTGYGYIRAGEPLNQDGAFAVAEFVEKPDQVTAQSYLDAGGYYWNSGMFMFRASRYLEELELFQPDMLKACRESHERAHRDLDFIRLGAEEFSACPSNSIDYAVMEKTGAAAVLPLSAGWSDVGSWDALWEVGGKDDLSNVIHGDVLTQDVKNCLLHSSGRMIAAIGVNDLAIVETADAVLVTRKNHSQDVKHIVEKLKASRRQEALLHRVVTRPWGNYECINDAERYQVKRITVNPGASLSLQMHHHRAEHWVVVKGTARVTCGEEVRTLSENQSTYIPLGVAHRLENPGRIPLELIEVQSGSYLGEDDIVRFDDQYGRG